MNHRTDEDKARDAVKQEVQKLLRDAVREDRPLRESEVEDAAHDWAYGARWDLTLTFLDQVATARDDVWARDMMWQTYQPDERDRPWMEMVRTTAQVTMRDAIIDHMRALGHFEREPEHSYPFLDTIEGYTTDNGGEK